MGKQKRIWRESQHPRDQRGRFSRRGGEAWIKRAAAELTSAPDAAATRDAAGRPRISRQAKAGVTLQAHAEGGRPSAVRVPQAVKSAAPSPKNLADFNAQRLPTARKTAAPTVNVARFNAPDVPGGGSRAADIRQGDYVRISGEDQYGRPITLTGYAQGAPGPVRIGKRGSKTKRDMVAVQVSDTPSGGGANLRGTVYAEPGAPIEHPQAPQKRTPRPAPGAAALIAARREEQAPQVAAMVAARTTPEAAPVNGADAYIAMRRHTLLALARDAKISIRGKTNTQIANELAAHDERVKADRAAKLNPSGVGQSVDTPRANSQDGGMTSTTFDRQTASALSKIEKGGGAGIYPNDLPPSVRRSIIGDQGFAEVRGTNDIGNPAKIHLTDKGRAALAAHRGDATPEAPTPETPPPTRRLQTFSERMAGDMTQAERLEAVLRRERDIEARRAADAERARLAAEARASDTRPEREKLAEQLQQDRAARDIGMRSGRLDPQREARIKKIEARLEELDTADRKAKIKDIRKGDKVTTSLGEFEVVGKTKDGYLRVQRPDGRRGSVNPKHIETVTPAPKADATPAAAPAKLSPSEVDDLREEYDDAKIRLNDLDDRTNSAQAAKLRARIAELKKIMDDNGVTPVAPRRFGRADGTTPAARPSPATPGAKFTPAPARTQAPSPQAPAPARPVVARQDPEKAARMKAEFERQQEANRQENLARAAARDANLEKARQAQRDERRALLNRTKDPKDNGAKIKALEDGTLDSADLYRTAMAGPSGQRAPVHVGRVRHTPDRPEGEFEVTSTNGGDRAGWATRVSRNGETVYAVHSENADGGTELLGWADTLAHAADVLTNGETAASTGGTLDARRISGRMFERNPSRGMSLDELELSAARDAVRRARETLDNPNLLPTIRERAQRELARREADLQELIAERSGERQRASLDTPRVKSQNGGMTTTTKRTPAQQKLHDEVARPDRRLYRNPNQAGSAQEWQLYQVVNGREMNGRGVSPQGRALATRGDLELVETRPGGTEVWQVRAEAPGTGPGRVAVGGTDADRAAARPRMEGESDRAYEVRTAPSRDAALRILQGNSAAGLRSIARGEGVVTSGNKGYLVARLIRVMRDRHEDSQAIERMVNRDRQTPPPPAVATVPASGGLESMPMATRRIGGREPVVDTVARIRAMVASGQRTPEQGADMMAQLVQRFSVDHTNPEANALSALLVTLTQQMRAGDRNGAPRPTMTGSQLLAQRRAARPKA